MGNKNKGILAYVLITFIMAWVLWEIPIRLGLSITSPLFQYVALPGAFSPAIAAVIVRKCVTREGFADSGLRPHLLARWRYYLFAWLLPVFVTAIIVGLVMVLGIGQPDFSLRRAFGILASEADTSTLPSFIMLPIFLSLLITSLVSTFFLWGEEFGWRSYLQIRLLADRPLLAAIVTGIIWGIWHYPINLRGYNFPGHPILGLLVFPISTIMLSIIFGWLRLRTRSVWAPSLAHAATNSIGGSLTILLFTGGPDFLFAGYLGLIGWIPLLALCFWIILTGRLKAASVGSNQI